MILRAKQEQDVVVFELEGTLDFETTHQLSHTCQGILTKNNCTKVVFDFERLKFVGSSGIHQFIDVLKDFNTQKARPRLCHLSVEFEKIVKAFQTAKRPFSIYTSRTEAIASFEHDKPEPVEKIAPKPEKKATAPSKNAAPAKFTTPA